VSCMALPAEKTACSAPSLANGGPFSIPDGCLDCEDGDDIIGDELDELLDSVSDPGDGGMPSAVVRGAMPTVTIASSIPFSAPLLGTLSVGARFVPAASLSEMYSQPLVSALDNFCSSLNSFSIGDSKRGKIILKQSLRGEALRSRLQPQEGSAVLGHQFQGGESSDFLT
ncbi:hypothetical protein E2320_012315, partial [Naja naja]